jgi:glutamate dehydrogenase
VERPLINNRRHRSTWRSSWFTDGVRVVQQALPDIVIGREKDALEHRLKSYQAAGVSHELATAIAVLPPAYAALTIVQTAAQSDVDVLKVADLHFTLGQRLGLDRLLTRIIDLPREDRWQTMARAGLRDDRISARSTHGRGPHANGAGAERPRCRHWLGEVRRCTRVRETLRSITSSRADLARMSVGLRVVRRLLSR